MNLNVKIAAAAEVAHEANRAWCNAIGDYSQLPWSKSPLWQTESALRGVAFHLENPEAGPSASHDSWMAEKVATGWVYGEQKDPDLKTHPCMVPFEDLPFNQQIKDKLFRSVVHAIFADEIGV